MLGRLAGDFTSSWDGLDDSWDVSNDEVSDPEQPATKRKKNHTHARAPKGDLLIALKGLLTQLIAT